MFKNPKIQDYCNKLTIYLNYKKNARKGIYKGNKGKREKMNITDEHMYRNEIKHICK